jgi:hypothetical protein
MILRFSERLRTLMALKTLMALMKEGNKVGIGEGSMIISEVSVRIGEMLVMIGEVSMRI